jgi:hypothetical protein
LRHLHRCFPPSGSRKILKRHFFHLHISHSGRLVSRWLVYSRYVWRGLAKDEAAWAKTCLHCQQSKIHCRTRNQPLRIPFPPTAFLSPSLQFGGML